jgi:NAD(P)-dependent dehydrogenase (short-subunit alcohol dehydrogenase family)
MGKLDGKVAVITGGSSGMALAGAKLFVDEGAHVVISGRRQQALDEAVELIGRNVTAVQADSANLDDLDRLFDKVKQEKGAIDVLWTSAGTAQDGKLGKITEEHFDATFGLNARGTLFTVQKALPLFNDGGSIFMTGSIASLRGYPSWSVYAASKAALHAYARVWLAELKDRRIRVNVLTPGPDRRPRTRAAIRRRDEGRDGRAGGVDPTGKERQPSGDRDGRLVPRLERFKLRQWHGVGCRRRHHRSLIAHGQRTEPIQQLLAVLANTRAGKSFPRVDVRSNRLTTPP